MQWKKFPKELFLKCDDFPKKNEIKIVRHNVPFYFYVSYFGEILFQENVAPNMHFVLVANTCTMAIEWWILCHRWVGFFFFSLHPKNKRNFFF
jgi:hypothetical protein